MAARYLGIDEHSYLKHFQFVTMVVDLEEQTVLHVADDRTTETLAEYFDGLSIEERLAIEAIAMDMWDPYRRTVATPHLIHRLRHSENQSSVNGAIAG